MVSEQTYLYYTFSQLRMAEEFLENYEGAGAVISIAKSNEEIALKRSEDVKPAE